MKTDRRIAQGMLTTEGRKIYHLQIKHMHNTLRQMLEILTPTEQESLLKIFHKLIPPFNPLTKHLKMPF